MEHTLADLLMRDLSFIKRRTRVRFLLSELERGGVSVEGAVSLR